MVAYGAAGGMATTLLTYLGLGADRELVDYAVDINPHKHGRYTAGSRLRIRPAREALARGRGRTYVLLLAWNFADARSWPQQAPYRAAGGRFLDPDPRAARWSEGRLSAPTQRRSVVQAARPACARGSSRSAGIAWRGTPRFVRPWAP